jgi:hypothetical protein
MLPLLPQTHNGYGASGEKRECEKSRKLINRTNCKDERKKIDFCAPTHNDDDVIGVIINLFPR